ncbi:MAG TPA: hypothetical protein VNV42_14915 [Solirubrobacteraceae bacterium]|jgi:hypothetical protein|nr:hypothetical protein [Solirubrobacteraceae bacterium]
MRLARIPRRGQIVTIALLASLACLGVASSSSANEHHPTGSYVPFVDCPLSDLSVEECFVDRAEGGEFVVGHDVVPVDSPLTLQGGYIEGEEGELTFVGAEDGDTLSKSVLSLPGGLAGVFGGAAGVTMTPELAQPASTIKLNIGNLLESKGVAVQLPLKLKLSNPFLGGECYLGSSADPIVLNFTVGATDPPPPNKSMRGALGGITFLKGGSMLVMRGTSLVDNAFAVPRAAGCGGGFSAVVDPAIDAEFGLPSPAGRNTAILNATIEQGAAVAVSRSE